MEVVSRLLVVLLVASAEEVEVSVDDVGIEGHEAVRIFLCSGVELTVVDVSERLGILICL